VGVVGLGTVGFAVAEAFHRFGCHIIYYDPAPRDIRAAAKVGARAVPLEELLRTADVVTLHVPLLPQTRSMIGMRQFSLMKPGAVLIQASRGGVVNEAALITHLHSGRLGGAAIDVYSTEPPDPDNPLFSLEGEAAHRVLFTPHIAGVTRQSSATLFRDAWANVERVLVRGEPVPGASGRADDFSWPRGNAATAGPTPMSLSEPAVAEPARGQPAAGSKAGEQKQPAQKRQVTPQGAPRPPGAIRPSASAPTRFWWR